MRIHLSVGQRIGLGFALLFLMVLIGGGLGLAFATSNFSTVLGTQEQVSRIENVAELERSWSAVAGTLDSMLLTRQTALIERELEPRLAAFDAQLSEFVNGETGDDGQGVAANQQYTPQLGALAAELRDVLEEIAVAAEEGRWARAQTLRHTELAAFERRFSTALAELTAQIEAEVEAAVAESRTAVSLIRVVWILLASFSLMSALGLGVIVARSVIRPVNELTESAARLAAGSFDERVALSRKDEIGELADAFNRMARQVQESHGQLERRVAERTQALETSLQVSRRLSTILEPQALVSEVVRQVQRAFDYYHVHIYLLDETGESLQMVGGTGEAGKTMLARRHQIPVGKGLVGRAVETRQTVLVPDVSQAPYWLPNALLPETKAEVATPIMFGSDVLGVLDVQEDALNSLDQDDVELLQAIASQVAIAIQNARLLQAAQGRAERATRLNTIGQKIQRATTVEEVLAVAARELGHSLEVGKARVELVNPGKITRGRPLTGNGEQQR